MKARMKARQVESRPEWQAHIQDNAYQSDVLSDSEQQYWVEALPTAFAIQFGTREETAIATATELLWEMCVEFLDWFFTEETIGAVDDRLQTLKIAKPYWKAIRESWDNEDPHRNLSLYSRFDLAVTETGQIKLLEINGETPLLGAETVYQWNWFVDYMAHHQGGLYPLPQDASQFNEFWEGIAAQWRQIATAYDLRQTGISFLVDENLSEDSEMAMQLVQILHDEVDPEIHVQLVNLRSSQDEWGVESQPGLGMDEAGYFVDHRNDRIRVLWKMYDWSDLQNDMANNDTIQAFVQQLDRGDTLVLEPLWKQVLSNKGAMAFIWQQFKNSIYHEYLLETYFDTDLSSEATTLLFGSHVKKPMLGFEGVGISIETSGGSTERRESLGYGDEGCILQEYIELPQAYGYHYVIGSWVIDGGAAGLIIRGDQSKITGRHCLIIPHIISDYD